MSKKILAEEIIRLIISGSEPTQYAFEHHLYAV